MPLPLLQSALCKYRKKYYVIIKYYKRRFLPWNVYFKKLQSFHWDIFTSFFVERKLNLLKTERSTISARFMRYVSCSKVSWYSKYVSWTKALLIIINWTHFSDHGWRKCHCEETKENLKQNILSPFFEQSCTLTTGRDFRETGWNIQWIFYPSLPRNSQSFPERHL